jgi:hypothetical protein
MLSGLLLNFLGKLLSSSDLKVRNVQFIFLICSNCFLICRERTMQKSYLELLCFPTDMQWTPTNDGFVLVMIDAFFFLHFVSFFALLLEQKI